ncbi:uncharacterized protein [Notamacropus eugenii]|uniref:uncharacterized protein isoform X2 n=1 Tax=Notamacropus eugenii TaxID=9315 RepID=UPI003B679BC0
MCCFPLFPSPRLVYPDFPPLHLERPHSPGCRARRPTWPRRRSDKPGGASGSSALARAIRLHSPGQSQLSVLLAARGGSHTSRCPCGAIFLHLQRVFPSFFFFLSPPLSPPCSLEAPLPGSSLLLSDLYSGGSRAGVGTKAGSSSRGGEGGGGGGEGREEEEAAELRRSQFRYGEEVLERQSRALRASSAPSATCRCAGLWRGAGRLLLPRGGSDRRTLWPPRESSAQHLVSPAGRAGARHAWNRSRTALCWSWGQTPAGPGERQEIGFHRIQAKNM